MLTFYLALIVVLFITGWMHTAIVWKRLDRGGYGKAAFVALATFTLMLLLMQGMV